jgi:hypothetical protein
MNSKSSATASTKDLAQAAFTEVVQAMAQDMPLLMHGSGDVQPSDVSKDSVNLLCELTANYICHLVEAAVDAHEMLNDGKPQPLPPPPLPKTRKTAVPAPPPSVPVVPPSKDSKDNNKTNNKDKDKPPRHTKRRRPTDEFWDEALVEPKIKGKPTQPTEASKKMPKFTDGVPVDEWVGVSGVDFWERDRARKAHVGMPAAIGTQCFIFPVCHDVGLYGKVLEVQAARRAIAPLLADSVVQDVLRKEGALQGLGALRKRRDKKKQVGGTDNSDDDDDDDEEEPEDTDSEGEDGGGATWPGLESLLPVHMTRDFRGM